MDLVTINGLLDVAEKSLKWPQLKAIHDYAMKELLASVEQQKEEPTPIDEPELPIESGMKRRV